MFKNLSPDVIFSFLYKRFKYDKKMRLITVDFQKPWWDLIWQQKTLLFISVLNQFLGGMFLALVPVFLGYIIENRDIRQFGFLILGMFSFRILAHILYYADPIFRQQSAQSIAYSAARFFLVTDPINHSERSSGQVLSKINRAASGIENLLGLVMFDFLSLLFTILGTVGAFWSFDMKYGLICLICLSVVLTFNITGFYLRSKIQKTSNQAEDDTNAINVETLQQVNYVRAAFATAEQDRKMQSLNLKKIKYEGTIWRLAGWIITTTQILFFGGLGLLGYLMLSDGQVGVVILSTLLISYFNIGAKLFFIGHSVNSMIKAYIGVIDLYDFIRGFGKQTYPVLEEDE